MCSYVRVFSCVCVSACVSESFGFHVLFFFYLEGLREGEGSKGKGIAEMTVSHTASNKIHGKIIAFVE